MKKLIIFFVVVINLSLFGQNPCPDMPTVTYAGKTYNTVQIGTQCWLKENLDVGEMIQTDFQNPNKTYQSNNGIIEKFCYNNDANNCTKYGGLYQWNEAMQYVTTERAKGICPTGWHIPSQSEIIILLKNTRYDSNSLIEVSQGQSTYTNSSGFSALFAGGYESLNFFYLGKSSFMMSSTTAYTNSEFFLLNISTISQPDPTSVMPRIYACSIRCIKD